MRRTLLAVAIAVAGLNTAMADEWFVEAHYPDHAALARAAAHFQHVIVDDSRNVLRVDTNEAGIDALQAAGLDVSIDAAATAKLRSFYAKFEQAKAAGLGPDSIPGFQCYRTVEETYQTMDNLVVAHPDIVAIDEIGPTWKKFNNAAQGYEMRALRITNLATAASDPNRPKMVVFSSIHAREYAPAEIDTRFAEWLVNNYGTDPEATWLIDHNDFRLILQANPDGRKQAEQQIYWRKNVDEISGNCDGNVNVDTDGDGIDLNRNFPFHWNITNGQGSNGNVCGETYRGPIKASEPETENLMQYVAGTCDSTGNCTGGIFADRRTGPMNPATVGGDGGAAAPDDTTGFFVDIHSYAQLILWPWGDTPNAAPNQSGLRTLGRRIAWFNNYRPQQSDELYLTDGTTDDTMYGLLGVPGFTIETDSAFFQDCGSFEDFTAPKNIEALRYAARTLHAPYRLPSGPDTIDVTATSDLIAAGDPIAVSAHLDSGRFNQTNGTEPVRNIVSAAAYVDDLPWSAGATPVALQANDGSFNSSIEAVNGAVPTTGLASGRHFVYVQGTDSASNAGTPNAAFVEIAAGNEIATLAGTITAHVNGAPVAATIKVSDGATSEQRATTSSAVDGHYQRTMLAGSVDVHVSASGYLTEDVAGLSLSGATTTTRDFSLLPTCTIFSDDVESVNTRWTAQSPWVIASNVTGNATHVWDTPNYADNLDSSLTSTNPYDLTGYSDIAIDFDDRCDTENGYDYGHVEFSADGGTNWTGVYSCSGQSNWQSHHIDLPAPANGTAALKLRFRLSSDTSQNAAGWAIDNIKLEAGGAACRAQQQPNDIIFADGFESP